MIEIEDIKIGEGAEAVSGSHVEIHYTGCLLDGTKFDSSKDRNQTFRFKLNSGSVIQGFDLGVTGMKVGGQRRITIPPEFGYGNRQVGPIPANSTLVFELDLVSVSN